MKKINDLVKKMLKIDKTISAGAIARILNGQLLRIDVTA